MRNLRIFLYILLLTGLVAGCKVEVQKGSGRSSSELDHNLKKYSDPAELYDALKKVPKVPPDSLIELLKFQGDDLMSVVSQAVDRNLQYDLVRNAVHQGDIDLLKALLDAVPGYGVEHVQAKIIYRTSDEIISATFPSREALLALAAQEKRWEIVDELLRRGADPRKGQFDFNKNTWDSYYTPTLLAFTKDDSPDAAGFSMLLKAHLKFIGPNDVSAKNKLLDLIKYRSDKSPNLDKKFRLMLDEGVHRGKDDAETIENLGSLYMALSVLNKSTLPVLIEETKRFSQEIGSQKFSMLDKTGLWKAVKGANKEPIEQEQAKRTARAGKKLVIIPDDIDLLSDEQMQEVESLLQGDIKNPALGWDIEIFWSDSQKRIFKVNNSPKGIKGVVVKTSGKKGGFDKAEERFASFQTAKKIVEAKELDRLVLPKTQLSKDKKFIIEEALDIGDGSHAGQQRVYEAVYKKIDNGDQNAKDQMGELFRQLAILAYAGLWDLKYDNLPLLDDGSLRIGLVDIEFSDYQKGDDAIENLLKGPQVSESVVHPDFFEEIEAVYDLENSTKSILRLPFSLTEAIERKKHERAYFKWLESKGYLDEEKVVLTIPKTLENDNDAKNELVELNKLYANKLAIKIDAVTLARRKCIKGLNIKNLLEALKDEGQIFDYGTHAGKYLKTDYFVYP